MAKQTPRSLPPEPPHQPGGGKQWRITAFWSVVGIVTVAAILSVSVESKLQISPAAAAPMSLAPSQATDFIPSPRDFDFNNLFGKEKRDAKAEELPPQF